MEKDDMTLWKAMCDMQKKDPVDENPTPSDDSQILWSKVSEIALTKDTPDYFDVWNCNEGSYFGYMASEPSLWQRFKSWIMSPFIRRKK